MADATGWIRPPNLLGDAIGSIAMTADGNAQTGLDEAVTPIEASKRSPAKTRAPISTPQGDWEPSKRAVGGQKEARNDDSQSRDGSRRATTKRKSEPRRQ